MSVIDEVKELIAGIEPTGATIIVNINVNVGAEAGPGDPPPNDPPPAAAQYKVSVDKPSKRAKVRPVANAGSGEIDYVYHGEIVTGPGKELNGFIYITDRVGDPVLSGYVEKEYLIAL